MKKKACPLFSRSFLAISKTSKRHYNFGSAALFFLALCFFLSRFFRHLIPDLHISIYLEKNGIKRAVSTKVEIFVFLPSVALKRTLYVKPDTPQDSPSSGEAVCSFLYEYRFWVRKIDPLCLSVEKSRLNELRYFIGRG